MKIAIVTGSNRGIGLEICRQLAGVEDIRVISTSRSEDKGRRSCKQLKSEGLDVNYRQLDVTDEQSIHACIDSVIDEYGSVDILVNNAGVFPDKRAASSWPSVFDTSIDIMLARHEDQCLWTTITVPESRAYYAERIITGVLSICRREWVN